eukprot:109173-Prorocentrum_minimum.AAC.1
MDPPEKETYELRLPKKSQLKKLRQYAKMIERQEEERARVLWDEARPEAERKGPPDPLLTPS